MNHYCAAIFKYLREAFMFKEHCAFVSTDDKCKIKVGEPNLPVAGVARGNEF